MVEEFGKLELYGPKHLWKSKVNGLCDEEHGPSSIKFQRNNVPQTDHMVLNLMDQPNQKFVLC